MVFEVIGPVTEFGVAAQALGLEWLDTDDFAAQPSPAGMADDEDAGSEEGEEDEASALPKLLYLTMPTERALQSLLSQWARYKAGQEPGPEYVALWRLFDYLHAMRVWSVEDRIDPSLAGYVEELLSTSDDRSVDVEIDLWYRTEKDRRDGSFNVVRQMVQEVGGEMLDLVEIEEIRYQGALVSVPASIARQLATGEALLAKANEVMTIRPQSAFESRAEAGEAAEFAATETQAPQKECVAVLLDGYPVEQHIALENRLSIVEVDVTGAQASADSRHHGTAMASLILHGDMRKAEAVLGRPLAVIPVLTAGGGTSETTPAGKLPIGVIYRALRAIVDAKSNGNEDLSRAVVVNHSICDVMVPFVRRPSPWATMLDYFSHEHQLLFIVSAGNVFSSLPLADCANLAAFQAMSPQERQASIVAAIERYKGRRGLLSPAESFNALTVGALHEDAIGDVPAPLIDPYPEIGMLNLASALGLGVNRSVKPDIIEAGGRFAVGCSNTPHGYVEIHPKVSALLGQQVASPSRTGRLNSTTHTAGTSNAAALITRASHFVADAVEELYRSEGKQWRESPTRAVVIKALLAHGCSWGSIGRILDAAYDEGPRYIARRRTTITRFLGYGRPELHRVVSGASNRVTLLAEDVVDHGKMHKYKLPIPQSMINNREIRRLTITLAWTCEPTHKTSDHRSVVLSLVSAKGDTKFWEGAKRDGNIQPYSTVAARGTLIHVTLSGKRMIKRPNEPLEICVQAMAKKGFETQRTPYALAITLELGQHQRSNLYSEVRDAVRTRTPVRLTT